MSRETRNEARRRRTLAVVLVALVVGPGAMATPSAWAAPTGDEPRLVLSVDGQAWVRDVTTPIFDPAHVWTAADTKTYTVQFRNDSGQDAEGFAELNLTGPAADMFDTRLRMDAGPWVLGPRSETVPVAPGQVVQVQMDLTLSESSTNPRTSTTADLAATITLRGADPDNPDPDGPGTDNPGGSPGDGTSTGTGTTGGALAVTGTTVAWTTALALTTILTGRALLTATRRRNNHATTDDTPH